MNKTALLITTMTLAACSSDVHILSPNEQAIAEKNPKSYQAMHKACIGIAKFAKYLTLDNYDATNYYEPKSFSYRYKVSDEFKSYWSAAGHNCHFDINSDYSSVIISKSGCISLCLDEQSDESNITISVK